MPLKAKGMVVYMNCWQMAAFIFYSHTLTFTKEINHACSQPCIFTKPPGIQSSRGVVNKQTDKLSITRKSLALSLSLSPTSNPTLPLLTHTHGSHIYINAQSITRVNLMSLAYDAAIKAFSRVIHSVAKCH